MKKTFRTLLAGALTLCAVACFDDTAIRMEIEDVKDDLKDLKEQFEEFKTQLNNEVATLKQSYQTLNASFTEYKGLNDQQVLTLNNALDQIKGQITGGDNAIKEQLTNLVASLDAYKKEANGKLTSAEAALEALQTEGTALKVQLENLAKSLDTKADAATLAALAETLESITVRTVAEVDGKVVITLANGEKLTVSDDKTGVVKVVDGEWYVVGEDGKETALELPVSTPDLSFDIDWETGELSYSTDGLDIWDYNKEWISTGITVGGNSSGGAVITEVDMWSSDNSIGVMVDGEWYFLPLMGGSNDAATTLDIMAGRTIVPFGETKVIEVKASGLADVYVMSKPEGWRVSVNGNKLTVSAPAAGNPYAEAEGLILLHGTTEDGKCVVAKLAVTTSTEGIDISVDSNTGAVVFKNGIVMPQMGGGGMPLSIEDEEEMPVAFAPFYLGIMDRQMWEWRSLYGDQILESSAFMSEYLTMSGAEVTTEGSVQVIKTDVSTLWNVMNFDPLMEGAQLVVFAVPISLEMNESYGMPNYEQLAYGFYSPSVNTMELLYATHNDIVMNVSRSGADYYYLGYGKAEEIEPGVFDSGMESSFMEWQYSGGQFAFGLKADAAMDQRVLLSEYASEGGEVSPLVPSTTYYVFAFPVTEGKAAADYSYETDLLPYVKFFTTEGVVEGGSSKASVVADPDMTTFANIVANISVEGDADYVYYKTYETNPENDFEEVSELVKDIITGGKIGVASEGAVERIYSLAAGTTRYIAAVAVDSDGFYGDYTVQSVSTKAYPYTDSISVSVANVVFEEYTQGEGESAQTFTKAKVTYNVTGADYLMVKGSWGDPTLTNLSSASQLITNMMASVEGMYVKYYPVVDGVVTVEYESYTSTYSHYSQAIGFNMTAKKVVTALCQPVVTDLNNWVK